jgi:transposase
MDIHVLGIDLGKNSCSVVGLDSTGRVVLRRRMRRESIVALAAKLPGCVVAMEACCGAHHLGRLLAEQGHEVRLMSPEYVRPYAKAHKNDDRDAEAIAEAATRRRCSSSLSRPRRSSTFRFCTVYATVSSASVRH